MSKQPHEETEHVLAVCKALLNGRDVRSPEPIMVTLEHVVATLLITMYGDPRTAAHMLNEGLVHGVEHRISLYHSKKGGAK